MNSGTLERDDELARITAALDAAAAGTGQLVVIEGPPGIGKTRLVDDVRRLAKERGFGRLHGVGDESERSLPWGVVRQLVERSVIRYSGDVREAILAGPAGAALTALDRAAETTDDAGLSRTLHALWWVAADLAAERPLLITVDDAQWADPPSLRYFGYLAKRLGDLHVALVIGTRPPEADDGPLVDLATGRVGERILLGPLSADGVRALTTRDTAAPADEVVTALYDASGGNPFLTGQLLTELDRLELDLTDAATAASITGLGPRTVSRALLSRLSDDGRALASAAAVLGIRSDPAAAAALAALDEDGAREATLELVKVFLVHGEGKELVFTHPVLRETVLHDLTPADRSHLHARAARALHESGAPPERIAVHLAAAPPGTVADARAILSAAGRRLLADGDAATAAIYFERALAETPADHELKSDLGFALLRAGRPAEARIALLESVREASSPRERAERLAAAASATFLLEGPSAAARELRVVLDDFDAGDDPGAALFLEARLAGACAFVPEDFERSGERLHQFADLPGDTRDERGLLRLVIQRAFSEVRPASEVLDMARRASSHATVGVAVSFEGLMAWGSGVHAVIHADGIELAERELDLARTRLLPGGSPLDFAAFSVCAALLAWRKGDVRQCETDAEACLAALRMAEATPVAAGIAAVATRAVAFPAIERNDLVTAAAILDSYEQRPEGARNTVPANRLLVARSALALAQGDPVLARKHAEALGEAEHRAGSHNPAIPWRVYAAHSAHRMGDLAGAQEHAANQLASAEQWGAPTELGQAHWLVARVGEPDDRLELLERALAVLEQSTQRLIIARALCDYGETLRVRGRRVDARDPLHRAAELAGECGSVVLRTRAIDALERLGDKPREYLAVGAEALTASERRVAELAVGGRSNREIAQEIFVTPKTVENHLGRVYIKLGIRGRRELAAALA